MLFPSSPLLFGTGALIATSLIVGCAVDTGLHDDDLGLPDRNNGHSPGSSTENTTSASQNGGGADDQGGKKRKQAVAFIHGTSDHGDVADLRCGGQGDEWHCVSATAVAEYWTQVNIDSERKRADGSKRPYVVIGCPLSAQTPWPNPAPVKPKNGPPEPGSAICVATEIQTFLNGPDGVAGNEDDIDDVVLVTHSGGSNVARYILQQHTAKPSFDRVHKASRGFIGIAAPSHGTYLADRVFRFSGLSISNKLLNAGYDDDGVDFIQTTKMSAWNRDPAKLANLDKDVAGVPSYMASGSFPDADGEDAKIDCGGGTETKGLNALHKLYLDANDPATFRDGCSDGFITCQSAMALANGDESRVVFGQLGQKAIGKTHFRAHNQSRRDCDGLDVDIRTKINAILDSAASSTGNGNKGGGGADDSKRLIATTRSTAWAPMMRLSEARFDRVAISADVVAQQPSSIVRVKVVVDSSNRVELMRGSLRDPSGNARAALSFERGQDGNVYAIAQLPPDAHAGSWMLHVGERAEDIEAHRDARLPVWVASSVGSIVRGSATVNADGTAATVLVTAKTTRAARVGVRATLVLEDSEGSWIVSTGQASADVSSPSGQETSLAFSLPLTGGEARARVRAGARLVVRDIALVSHDDASTLDLRDHFDVAK